MARKIKELHQNNINQNNFDYQYQQINDNNSDKNYILSKMRGAYGQKGNYHLNEYNIEYSPNSSAISKVSNKNNNLRLKNYKNKDINTNKRRGKSSYIPYNIENEEIDNSKDYNINNNIKIKKRENSFLNDMTNNINNNNDEEKNKTDKLYYTFDNNNNNNFQINIVNYFMSCKFLFTMSFTEIQDYLDNLWKKLGVRTDYINIFNFQKNNFDNEEEKTDFLILEIENLKKFEDILIKLSKEIDSREKNINDIRKLTEEMKQIEENENSINKDNINNKKIMNCFFNFIISYRVHSIKVVEYYLLFKEKVIQGNFRNKYDEEFIQKKYGLIKDGINYLLKMRNDMNFLTKLKLYSNKNIEDIFNSFKGDPFLSSLFNIVPASREYKQRIKYCEYFIMQENLYNKNNPRKNIGNNSYRINENNEYKNYQKKKLDPIININKYKTEFNDCQDYNKSPTIDKTKENSNETNSKKNDKELENNKISEFNYKDNLNVNEDIINLNIKKTKLEINCEKELIKNDINNKKEEENILQNSLIISKKIKKKDGSRPVTPESKKLIKNENDPKDIKSYNTSYYCGSLSDFVLIYNNYYKRIPIEQKRIFNIKSNPLEYFSHNYYPKIIICSDTKLTLTKGICIYSIQLNYDNKPNKIIIEHISSYNKEDMNNIITNIFNFLKANNILSNSSNHINIEIYIDLYFYLDIEKFVIDTNIRDFIKNELKFKWVKLENISKEIRYQKMKHQFSNDNNITISNNDIDDNNILNQSIIGKKALKDLNENNDDSKYDNNNIICNFLIKNKSIIKYLNKSEHEKKIEEKLIFNNVKYINPFNILYLIKKIPEDCIYSEYIENNLYNFFNMNDHLDLEEILNNNDSTSLNDILVDNSFLSSNIEHLTEFFNNKYNKKVVNEKNKFDVSSKMNIYPLFDNCICVKYKNIYFNRIENENMKILIEKETKQKFYFITPNNNKNDKIIILISSSVNDKFYEKYIMNGNNSNLSLKFIDIYNNITSYESDSKTSTNKKYLYIPSFIINSEIKLNYKKHKSPDNQEEVDENNNDLFIINKYKEYFRIKFVSEEFIDDTKNKNKRNKKSSSTNFFYDKIEEDYINNKVCIIDNNFVIFVLNFDIIDNFAAIPLLSLYVTKDNFISDKID